MLTSTSAHAVPTFLLTTYTVLFYSFLYDCHAFHSLSFDSYHSSSTNYLQYPYSTGKADIRNPHSLLAHERSRFATCQWELLTPTDVSIPLTHRLVLYALEAGECLFCVHTFLHHYTITFIVSTQKISFTLFLFRMIILSHTFYSQIFCKISFNPFAE